MWKNLWKMCITISKTYLVLFYVNGYFIFHTCFLSLFQSKYDIIRLISGVVERGGAQKRFKWDKKVLGAFGRFSPWTNPESGIIQIV